MTKSTVSCGKLGKLYFLCSKHCILHGQVLDTILQFTDHTMYLSSQDGDYSHKLIFTMDDNQKVEITILSHDYCHGSHHLRPQHSVNGKQIQICELRCSVINTLAGASGSQIN